MLLRVFTVITVLLLSSQLLFADPGGGGAGTVGNTSNPQTSGTTINDTDASLLTSQTLEKNDIADTLCIIVRFITGPVGKIFGSLLVVLIGIASLQAQANPKTLISCVLCLAVIFGSEHLITLLAPSGKLKGGCKCKTALEIGKFTDPAGNVVVLQQDLKLNDDCSYKTT